MNWDSLDTKKLWPLQQCETAGLDLYVLWAAATNFRNYVVNRQFAGPPGESRVPVLLRARNPAGVREFANQPWVQVPLAYTCGAVEAGLNSETRHFTALVRLKDLGLISGVTCIESWELGLPVKAPLESDPASAQETPVLSVEVAVPGSPPRDGYAGRAIKIEGPTVAVIDYGCAFLNQAFRDKKGRPRLHSLWDQNEAPLAARTDAWKAPDMFGYGRVLDAGAVRQLVVGLHSEDDESDAYRSIRYLHEMGDPKRPIKREVHGTHVLDVAAGSIDPWRRELGAFQDAASQANLLFVQLPVETIVDSSGGSLAVHVLDAVRDILLRTDPALPLVVVLSQGTHAGPHDGSTLIETALDELLERRANLQIVIGAGNGRRTQTNDAIGCHAQATLGPGETALFQVHIPPGDRTDTFVEIWCPAAHERLAVRVKPPEPLPASPLAKPGAAERLMDRQECVGAVLRGSGPHNDQSLFALTLVALAPALGPPGVVVPAGLWGIEVKNEDAYESLTVHTWVERDDPLRDEANDWPRLIGDLCSETSTLNSLATGRLTTIAGAMQRNNQAESPYSGRGPGLGTSATLVKPDLMVVADESAALPGVRAAAVRSGTQLRMGGTSVAAPTLARRLLEVMVKAGSEGEGNKGGSVPPLTPRERVLRTDDDFVRPPRPEESGPVALGPTTLPAAPYAAPPAYAPPRRSRRSPGPSSPG